MFFNKLLKFKNRLTVSVSKYDIPSMVPVGSCIV